ncbi:hypothetical protein CDL15_Pgr009351 [Punica granatum]|uniref:Uncharacterized protein n=1 Tax=Punica granatum TaxID=22663 RepID=A0A218XGQ4_PUNGR|nr:hypothetical protein CDL15_Pgr009351 [Punica granatum]PKI51004.1 hypothetical protein CRG98_028601 [Punica granatum]
MSHLQVQLQNFIKILHLHKELRVRVKPEVEENGQLLHLHKDIGGFNEWIVLTYNLQVLREVINKNIKLRKEILDLMGNFVKLVLFRCNVLSPEQCMTFPESSGDSSTKQGTWWAWLFAILSPKLQWAGTCLPCLNNQDNSEWTEINNKIVQLQVQLQNFKSRIGVKPEVEENDRFVHLHKDIGGFNEWIALTYNLQVLQDIIRENIKLRKEIFDFMGNFVKLVLIRCNVLKPDQCMTFPASYGDTSTKQGTWWAWLFAILSPKLHLPGTSIPNPFEITCFPSPLPGTGVPGGAFLSNQAVLWAWVASLMNPADSQKPGANLSLPGSGASCFPNPLLGTAASGGASSYNQAALWAWLMSIMNLANPQQPGTSPSNLNLLGSSASCFPTPPLGTGASSNDQAALWALLVSMMNPTNPQQSETSPPNLNLLGPGTSCSPNLPPSSGSSSEASSNNQAALWAWLVSMMNLTNPQQPGTSSPNLNLLSPGTACSPTPPPSTGGASSNNQAALWAWLMSMMNTTNPQQHGTFPPSLHLPGPGASGFPNPPLGTGVSSGESSNNQAALWAWLVSMMNPANPQLPGTNPPNLNLLGSGTSSFPTPPPGTGVSNGASSNDQAALWALLVSMMNPSNPQQPVASPPNPNCSALGHHASKIFLQAWEGPAVPQIIGLPYGHG